MSDNAKPVFSITKGDKENDNLEATTFNMAMKKVQTSVTVLSVLVILAAIFIGSRWLYKRKTGHAGMSCKISINIDCSYQQHRQQRFRIHDDIYTGVMKSYSSDASVVQTIGSGRLQANLHVEGPWLSAGKPNRSAITTMGSNDTVVGEDHMFGPSCQRHNWQTGR